MLLSNKLMFRYIVAFYPFYINNYLYGIRRLIFTEYYRVYAGIKCYETFVGKRLR